MDKIDLRSDTVTHPTQQMREAMANAVVGDDVYGDDPTTNELEARAADMFGKESAILVASGTQGNMASVLSHCNRGEEIVVGKNSHIFKYEGGNPATLGGVHSYPLTVHADGTLSIEEIEAAIRPDDAHHPRTKLVCLENTQGGVGGQPLPVDYIDEVGAMCKQYGLKLHIDGARIFNAATAVDETVARVTQAADSVSFCLSKGLCAPIGGIVVGDEDFIYHVRRMRKTMGGGMRQTGIIAAAGIIAIEEMSQRLHEDHENACYMAQQMAEIPYIKVDPTRTTTNFVMWELTEDAPISPESLLEKFAEDNIVARLPRSGKWRFVTHYWITRGRVDHVLNCLRRNLAA